MRKEKNIIGSKNKNYLSAFQLLERIIVHTEGQLLDIASIIKEERPVLCSFSTMEVDAANRMIGFLSGVVFAMDGITSMTDEKTILFAPKSALQDGSIEQFIKERK